MEFDLRELVFQYATRVLTQRIGNYVATASNDLARLRRHIRKGDVLLVSGDQRISEVIKYLTQSSWSHAAIYVGDEISSQNPGGCSDLEQRFGEDAPHLLVEALIDEGVVLSPLAKYRTHHLRVCRPFGIRPEDLEVVLRQVLDQVGREYDVQNLVDLARYFLPVSLVPPRFREHALRFGSGRPTEVICSTMIARAFEAVGFPILPRFPAEEPSATSGDDAAPTEGSTSSSNGDGPGTALRRLYHDGEPGVVWPSRRPLAKHLRMAHRPPGLITPRDFDLSPYFEVVKYGFIADSLVDRAGDTESDGAVASQPHVVSG